MDFDTLLNEALDDSERRKRGRTMKRNKNKIKRSRERQKKKRADKGRLEKRSRRSARKVVRDKITGGKDYKDMSSAQKKSVDKRVDRRKKAVDRLSKRLLNKKRRQDAGVKEEFDYSNEELFEMVDQSFEDEGETLEEKALSFERSFKEKDKKKAIVIYALDRLHKMIQSKGSRESVEGYAFDIKRSISLPISARKLADLYRAKYDPSSNMDIDYNAIWESKSFIQFTKDQLKAFENALDKLFKKVGIDFRFTKHFADRLNDPRNQPRITKEELAKFFKKIYKKQGKSLKSMVGAEAVLKDVQKHLNMPVAIEYDRKNDEIDVITKTIMRKKNFTSSSKFINY